jgi:hypothetical protein
MKLEAEMPEFGNVKAEISESEAKAVTQFLEGLVPEFVKEGGGILADKVRYWRWKNQINIVMRAKTHIDNLGLQPKFPPLKIIVPLLESASLEEDESIQQMWSRLLASALVDDIKIVPNHILTLRQLSPVEVKVLDWMYRQFMDASVGSEQNSVFFSADHIAEVFDLSNDDAQLILEDLTRLGISVKPGVITKQLRSTTGHLISTNLGPNCFQFCQFGLSFMKACKEGPSKE